MANMDVSSLNNTYHIQQVADITGISKQLIRKWEARYNIIQPKRLDNGYRVYNDADINILLHMKALAEQGHSIKQAAQLVKDAQQSNTMHMIHEHSVSHTHEEMNEFVIQLLEKGTNCNEQEVHLLLQQAYHHLGLERFMNTVIIPLLKEVGDRWQSGQWCAYQESLVSFAVRDFLILIRRNFQYKANAPLALGACLPNEQHEIPVHLLLIQLMLQGWKTTLIGASPAPDSIESFVEKLKPQIVFLSASTTLPFEMDGKLAERLDLFAKNHPETRFYMGGAGTMKYQEHLNLYVITIVNTLKEIKEFK